jgi:AcrR family transcriptional regulator
MPRLSRKEKQAQTRSCLMRSAAKLFAQRGLQNASIDDVAEDAGFTKGAFYANFASKEELFLAMLDDHFDARIAEIESLIASDESEEEKVRRAGAGFTRMLRSDPESQRLLFEFTAYAVRNEEFRAQLLARSRALRGRMAAALAAHAEELGLEPSIPADDLAVMISAMARGFAAERLLEGDDAPDELFAQMLLLFLAGLRTLSADRTAAAAARAV